jgi:hemolysin D
VSFALWAMFSKVDLIVVGKGRLVNPQPNVVVQPLETSIVQKINVQIGQVVRKGDLLATLDPTFAQADEAQLRTRLRSLDMQSASLNADLKGDLSVKRNPNDADSVLQAQLLGERQATYNAQLRKYDETVSRLKASLETNHRDLEVLSARLKSVREIEAMQEKLIAQNFGARVQLLQAQDRRLEVERDMLLTRNRENEVRSELAASEADRAAFIKGSRQKTMEDLLNTMRERDGINEQLSKADKRHKLVNLVAPEDGVVLDIAKLSPGSIVREAEAFFTLVPLGAQMEAEVQIDAADVGYIKAGDKAEIKLDAFPFQKHGGLEGKIRTISEDSFRRDAQNGASAESFYVSRVAYGGAKLKNMDRSRLLPGMSLTAEIVVGKRSVMSYLLWPLTKTISESLREP